MPSRLARSVGVVGLGYVGLPLAQAAADSGWSVLGIDQNRDVVEGLISGRSHIGDITDQCVQTMFEQGFHATTQSVGLDRMDVVVICVPTPLSDRGGPDLTAVKAAGADVAANLRPAALVILESTSYPGTTEEILQPILETSGLRHGRDFLLAFSPERVDPGSSVYGIRNTPKIVGGVGAADAAAASAFYETFVDEVVVLSGTREAEMAKLLENTYRHVNIALVNELAKFCHELDIDIWEVIRGAETKPFGFQKFTPGPGVGGHCIPIDPNYLSYEVRRKLGVPFRFVELAQEINDSMPSYVADRIGGLLRDTSKSFEDASILLLGVTYKAGISDVRESPAVPLARLLLDRGATVAFHDPFVESWNVPWGRIARVAELEAAVRESDMVVLLQNHSQYDVDRLATLSTAFFDTRGAVSVEGSHRL